MTPLQVRLPFTFLVLPLVSWIRENFNWKWQWRVCFIHCWLMWAKTAYAAAPCPNKVWKTDLHLWMMRILTDRATRDQDGMTETSPTIAWSDSHRIIYAGKDLQEHQVQLPTRPTKPHHWTMSLIATSTRLLTAFRDGDSTTLCMKEFFPLPSLNLPWCNLCHWHGLQCSAGACGRG